MGRRRKPGQRFQCGKLKRVDPLKPTHEPMSGAYWQRLVYLAKRGMVDPRVTTELGRLQLDAELTVAQVVAGHKVAEIYGRYEHFIQKSRSARSPSYEIGYGEAGVAEEALGEVALGELEDRVEAATRAWKALQKELNPWLRATLEQLCVENSPIGPAMLPHIRAQLNHLANVWHVTTGDRHEGASAPAGKRSIPLHFNNHEQREDVRRPADGPELKRVNVDRIAWMKVQRVISPHLNEEQLAEAYEKLQTLKAREIYRQQQEKLKALAIREAEHRLVMTSARHRAAGR